MSVEAPAVRDAGRPSARVALTGCRIRPRSPRTKFENRPCLPAIRLFSNTSPYLSRTRVPDAIWRRQCQRLRRPAASPAAADAATLTPVHALVSSISPTAPSASRISAGEILKPSATSDSSTGRSAGKAPARRA